VLTVILRGVTPLKSIYKDKYIKLGLKTAYYRKLRGYTQESLAETLELSTAFIGQIECGLRCMSLDNLFKLSETLNVPVMKFFDFEGD
jgi:transcriptional regulator with XRE-family HTH domain